MTTPKFLTAEEVAARWGLPVQTLANWRYHGQRGPAFIKIERKVFYTLDEVERYELENLQTSKEVLVDDAFLADVWPRLDIWLKQAGHTDVMFHIPAGHAGKDGHTPTAIILYFSEREDGAAWAAAMQASLKLAFPRTTFSVRCKNV